MGVYRNMIDTSAHVHHTVLIGHATQIWHGAIILEGASIGQHCVIGAYTLVGRRAEIGDYSVMHHGAAVPDNVHIGRYVMVGAHAVLSDVAYPNLRDRAREVHRPPVIENDVVIGSGAHIMPGVVLHQGCVVGAGSVVTRDVAAGMVVAGNPARRLWKTRGLVLNENGDLLATDS